MNNFAGTAEATTTANNNIPPRTAHGMAHQRCRPPGARAAGTSAGTMSSCVSITEVTTAAGWITGLAIVALIATGWRKTARAAAQSARGRTDGPNPSGVAVHETAAPLHRPPSAPRRVWAALAGTGLAIWVGAILATALGFGVAFLVITLTSMLKR